MAQANNPPLIDGLIRADSRKLFVDGLETIYDYWVPLLRRTTLPREVTSTDPRVAVVFRDLGQLVASPDVVIARLASIQLTRLMHSLKEKIKVDRQNGRIFPMKRTDSVAVDMYLYSLGRHHDQVARRQAVRQLRMSKRWADLAKESPLLIITHSEKATKLVSDVRISTKTLQGLAVDVLAHYPSELVNAAACLAKIGDIEGDIDSEARQSHLEELRVILNRQVV